MEKQKIRTFLFIKIIVTSSILAIFPLKVFADVTTWQKSVSITPKNSTDFSSDSFKQSLKNYQTTGGNYVTFIIPYYQSSQTSSDLKAGSNTPTNTSIRDAIRYAKSLNFKVALKPHPELSNGGWRGNIDPSNRSTWFAAYEGILMNLARIGAEEGVEELVIGTELRKVASGTYNSSNTQYWNNIISNIKSVFSGKLSYSAQWSGGGTSDSLDEKQNIKFWDKLDYLGLSAYWPLAPSDKSPSVQTIQNAWDSLEKSTIGPWQQKFNKPVMFTEVGYRSLYNSNADPWEYNRTGSVDTGLQSRLYEALYSYWNSKSYFQGVHWWEWETNPAAGGSSNIKFTPQNKPAQQVMATWNKKTSSTTPPPPNSGYSSSAVISPTQPSVGQTTNFTVRVSSSSPTTNQIIDIEIYDPAAKRILQKYYTGQNLSTTGVEYKFTWNPVASGTHVLKVGVFSRNWTTLYYWNNNLASFGVGGSSASTAYTSSATSSPSAPSSGQATTITAFVKSITSQSNLLIDIEVYNSANSKVAQRYYTSQTLSANTNKSFTASWTPSATGSYKVKVGVFANNSWGSLVHWNNTAGSINVGTSTATAVTVASEVSSSTSTTKSSSSTTDTLVEPKPANPVISEKNPSTTNNSSNSSSSDSSKEDNKEVVKEVSKTDKTIEAVKEVKTLEKTEKEKEADKALEKASASRFSEKVNDVNLKILKPELQEGEEGSNEIKISLAEIEKDYEVIALLEGLKTDEYDMYVSVNDDKKQSMRGRDKSDDLKTPHKVKKLNFSKLDLKVGDKIMLKFSAKVDDTKEEVSETLTLVIVD